MLKRYNVFLDTKILKELEAIGKTWRSEGRQIIRLASLNREVAKGRQTSMKRCAVQSCFNGQAGMREPVAPASGVRGSQGWRLFTIRRPGHIGRNFRRHSSSDVFSRQQAKFDVLLSGVLTAVS